MGVVGMSVVVAVVEQRELGHDIVSADSRNDRLRIVVDVEGVVADYVGSAPEPAGSVVVAAAAAGTVGAEFDDTLVPVPALAEPEPEPA